MAQAGVPNTLPMVYRQKQKGMTLHLPVQLRLQDCDQHQGLVKLQSLLQGHHAGQVAGNIIEYYRELGYLSKMANRRDFLNALNLRITHPF